MSDEMKTERWAESEYDHVPFDPVTGDVPSAAYLNRLETLAALAEEIRLYGGSWEYERWESWCGCYDAALVATATAPDADAGAK